MNISGKPPLDHLANSARSLGIETIYPDLPDKAGSPKPPVWREAANRAMPIIDKATALVSFSLGYTTALNAVAYETRIEEVGLLVIIAPSTPSVVRVSEAPFLLSFFEHITATFERVAKKAKRIEILTSDNDRWANFEYTLQMARALGASLHIIHNGGHLDTESGFIRFPLVLDMIAPAISRQE
ncbi:alpha/beta hydrolase [Candidatus Micrarchaeota archaeon]|nr:alpha/beta hydrolase [Candidatus Micrarchaeota archaeon]